EWHEAFGKAHHVEVIGASRVPLPTGRAARARSAWREAHDVRLLEFLLSSEERLCAWPRPPRTGGPSYRTGPHPATAAGTTIASNQTAGTNRPTSADVGAEEPAPLA